MHLCVHLVWQCSFDIGWLFSILFPVCFVLFFSWSIFSSEVHLPSYGPQCSALLCSPFQATIWSRCAFSWSFFFFYVIDPFSSIQVCAWCSFYWLSDWQKLFKFFFFSLEVNSKDIGGSVGGELGVGCGAKVKGGWQTRLNCFKIALCSS